MGVWTARQVWNAMAREDRESAARALWQDEQVDRAARARALVPWLAARGLRLQYVEKLSRARRAGLMAAGGVPEETAQQLVISFHLVHRRELLSSFLDTLGIPHRDGLIDGEAELEPPDRDAVARAVAAVRDANPPEHVELYLRTLTATDAHVWAAVAEQIDDPA